MQAHVRIQTSDPDPSRPLASPEEVAPVTGLPGNRPHCPTCGRMVERKRPASYCSARCRAQASRDRREAELRAGLRVAQEALERLQQLVSPASVLGRGSR
jgi:predicted nucleic acid-binding Zn ribbon protein